MRRRHRFTPQSARIQPPILNTHGAKLRDRKVLIPAPQNSAYPFRHGFRVSAASLSRRSGAALALPVLAAVADCAVVPGDRARRDDRCGPVWPRPHHACRRCPVPLGTKPPSAPAQLLSQRAAQRRKPGRAATTHRRHLRARFWRAGLVDLAKCAGGGGGGDLFS